MFGKSINETAHFQGIIPPLVTPFTAEGMVDEHALRAVIDFVIAGGVHGVFVAGSTGEAYLMNDLQRLRVLEITIEHVAGRVPVFAGTSHIGTGDTVRLTQAAAAAGADAASIVTPFFSMPSQDELYQHYVTVAKSVSIPILLYNNPARTGVTIEPTTLERLSRIDNIVGVKDSSGNMANVIDAIRLCGDDFGFFCGFDMIIYPTLVSGGAGAVPASANIAPRLVVDLYECFRAGDLKASRELQFRLAPLRRAFSLGTFPSVLKEGLNLLGVSVGVPVLPATPLTPTAREALRKILVELSLLSE